MLARELLLECKIALNVSTDYALAQKLQIKRQMISKIMKGTKVPDEYEAFRIAEALGRDPAQIIAELRAEEGGKHSEFFRDFLSRRGLRGLLAGVMLLSFSGTYSPELRAAETRPPDAHNDRLRKTNRRKAVFLCPMVA